MRIWDEISAACERDELVEGTIVGRVKGGLSVDIGVKAFLPGSPGRHPPGPEPRQAHRREVQVQGHQVQQEARQHRAVAPRAPREGARGAEEGDPQEPEGGRGPQGRGQEPHRLRRVHRPRRHRRPARTSPTCRWGRIGHPSRDVQRRRRGPRRRPQVRPRAASASAWASSRSRRTRGTAPTRSTRSAPASRARSSRLTDYGAFIEIEQGVEGLVHVSEMSWTKRVKHPSKLVDVGRRGRGGRARHRSRRPSASRSA